MYPRHDTDKKDVSKIAVPKPQQHYKVGILPDVSGVITPYKWPNINGFAWGDFSLLIEVTWMSQEDRING